MKKISFEIKFLLVFILIGALLFIGLFMYKSIKKDNLKKESFRFYEYHNFVNNADISKTDLISDYYLISLLRIKRYNGIIDKNNIEDIMIYYLLNITKNKSEKIILKDDTFNFCIDIEAFKRSFKEFFDYDITSSFNLLKDVDFVKYSNEMVCFDIGDEILYDYYTLIGVQNIEVNGDIISAKIYLYDNDFENQEEEFNFKNRLISSINSNNLSSFNNTLSYYEEKNIRFKEIPDGDFFKYQILYVSTK